MYFKLIAAQCVSQISFESRINLGMSFVIWLENILRKITAPRHRLGDIGVNDQFFRACGVVREAGNPHYGPYLDGYFIDAKRCFQCLLDFVGR